MHTEEESRTPAWLRRLRVERIALVDQGANPHAHISLWKARDLPEQGRHMKTTTSQTQVFESIRKAALQRFPDVTEVLAIDRFTSETAEGIELAQRHSQAEPDYEPEEEKIEKAAEYIGGSDAHAIAESLDQAATELANRTGVSKEAAYDAVFATSEGQALKKRYDSLVRG